MPNNWNTKKYVLCTLIIFLSLSPVYPQLTVGTQIRPRAEFRNGFKTLTISDRDAAFFVEQRSRIYAHYNAEKFQVKVNFQDIRIWGSTSQIYKTDNDVLTNVYEAWGLYKFSPKWSVKMGRMDLDYDNARFLGNLDWAAQGRSHDAALVSHYDSEKKLRLDVGGAFNQQGFEPGKLSETFYTGVNNYKTMQYAWLNKQWEKGSLSLLVHNDGRQVQSDSTTAMRQTYALIGNTNLGSAKLGGELYYQGGDNATGGDVSAYLISGYATLITDITPITLGFDYLSGTSIQDDKDRSFAPLYGTNHKFYGYMDYFYVGNAHGQGGNIAGLLDVHLKMKFKTGKNSSLVANTHVFNSAAQIYSPTDTDQEESKYLGTEVDLVYNLKVDDSINLNLGYSQMFAGESMELVKTAPGDHNAFNNWVWFMINFNPTIFNGKPKE